MALKSNLQYGFKFVVRIADLDGINQQLQQSSLIQNSGKIPENPK